MPAPCAYGCDGFLCAEDLCDACLNARQASKGVTMPNYDNDDDFEPDYDPGANDFQDFADPGGRSALRAATPDNPRTLPCPTCKAPDRLTPRDRALGYQCDACADRAERGGDY